MTKQPSLRTPLSWILYDFGNSAFVLVINSVAFSVYFRNVVFNGEPSGDFYWGLAVSSSLLLSALLGPFIGSLADQRVSRRTVFCTCVSVAVIGTFMMMFLGRNDKLLAVFLFMLSNASFNTAAVIYDSYLPIISPRERMIALSGLGWAFGYLGGILCLGIVFPFLREGNRFGDEVGFPIAFGVTAVFFLLFSLPALKWLPKSEIQAVPRQSVFQNVMSTVRSWREHDQFVRLLIAMYFVMDAVTTIVYFTSIYATSTLKLSVTEVMLLLLGTQLIAVPSTIIFSKFAKRIGIKTVFLCSLVVWMIDVGLLAMADSKAVLFSTMVVTGLVIGTTQAVGRAWLATLVKVDKTSELFGFSTLGTRVSSLLGPLIFGAVASVSGSQRAAVWSLLVFLVLGFLFALKVKEPASS